MHYKPAPLTPQEIRELYSSPNDFVAKYPDRVLLNMKVATPEPDSESKTYELDKIVVVVR